MNVYWQWTRDLSAMRLAQISLFTLPLIDEIVSTVPVLALPLLRTEMGLTYREVGWLLGIGGLAAWLVEPSINAFSDHWPKQRMILLAMLGMVLGLALAASSPTFGVLLLAFLLMGVANGPILGIGQAFLIDGRLDVSLRTMTRWTLMGALGDLAGPLLIGAAFAWGMGWRTLFWASALLWLVALGALAIQRLPETTGAPDENEEENGPVGWRTMFDTVHDELLLALRTPSLLRWLLLVMMPSFLDEMFLGFAALLLQDRIGMTPAAISMAIGVHVAGGLIGLVLLDRIGDRLPAAQALGWLALVVAVGLLLFVLATTAWLAVVALWIIGLGVSGWYPIAAAEAYRAFPRRSGIVRALYSLTTPLEVLAPLLIGLAAESWGIQAGVTLLLLAPLAVLILRPRATESALES